MTTMNDLTLIVIFFLVPFVQKMPGGIVQSEFIFKSVPFESCHASTIVETKEGLVSAWFGGKFEQSPDVGIWLSRYRNARWTRPVQIADGVQEDGHRYPCWNPVLFQPKAGPLLLFYKVGPNPRSWWGMIRTSNDCGQTWSLARRLPHGILGPIKNKPIQLQNGDMLCGSSTEDSLHNQWYIHFERTTDNGKTWSRNDPDHPTIEINAIQPSILVYSGGQLQAIGRTRERRIFETWSCDSGRSWSGLSLTTIPNPNSGIDAVTLTDGRQLLVYNHSTKNRSPLNIAVTQDGKDWMSALELEKESGEFSYPAVIQSTDGLVHITYTWKRLRIKHVVVDPSRLSPKPLLPLQ
jgi:predicted neuraminidase